jgi:N-acyl-D-aspartate/D-glutamate deacylase
MSERVVIKGGTVVDGSGQPGFAADVAIEHGTIAEIGPQLHGDQRVDASGCVVAPGFVDIHTHYDAQVFWDPALTPSCFHGVTTVVAGNCGFSIAPVRPEDRQLIANTMEKVEDMDPATLIEGVPWDFETFPEYLASVQRHGTALNYAAYIGHTALRIFAMGDEAVGRPATPDEIEKMAAIVRDAMAGGAAGFATSFAPTHRGADGQPIPSRWAERDEIKALCQAVADSGRGIVGFNGGTNISFTELHNLQLEVGVPFTFTALLTTPSGAHDVAMRINREGWARGAKVWPQVSCRPLSFSMTMAEPFTLNINSVFAELMPKSLEERKAAYADPAWRDRVRAEWANSKGQRPRWDSYEVMESSANPDLIGCRLQTLAEKAGTDAFDVLCDLAVSEDHPKNLRVKAILANDDVDGITMLLREEHTTLGLSDAGAHVGQLCDAPLPTDLLGKWVRDRGTIPMETAIRKLTGLQADIFNFKGRGYLREGYAADVVVFDPDTVAPGPVRRVRDFPAGAERLTADAPSGVHHVFVNGTALQLDGAQVPSALDARPGQLLSPAPWSAA